MPRAIWTGTIGFGLVQIPVSIHSAEETDELDLTLLDRRDFSAVGYQRVNKKTGKEVPWEEIVKGYEHGKGKYVVISDADFAEANVEKTHRVEITDFVDFSAIDPRYLDRPYYLAPQKAGRKAYALLRETLRRTGKAGIGKVVIRTRQHLAAVVPREEALLLVILRFADELRDAADLDLPTGNLQKHGITPKELDMAEKLVAAMEDDFKPEKYEDDYRRDLMKLIQKKAKAGELNRVSETPEEKPPRPSTAKIIDLAALLANSLSRGKAPRRAAKASQEKPARKLGKAKPAARRKAAHREEPRRRKSA
jgi:DNA end-binding protein Ku